MVANLDDGAPQGMACNTAAEPGIALIRDLGNEVGSACDMGSTVVGHCNDALRACVLRMPIALIEGMGAFA
jgi:hypothetical protein